ncbi:hypothetical protein [Sphingomonas sp.]|uniref:hypothetical protein n=1 Tax=Sphingomonas sp. TaxID=28214 RepID=UPI003569DDDF
MTILADLRMWEAATMNLDHKRVQSQAAEEIERLRSALQRARDALLDHGDERTIAPEVEAIDAVLTPNAQVKRRAKPVRLNRLLAQRKFKAGH